MRLVGGTYRGRRLVVPRGLKVRPTTDRVREAVFNVLGSRVQGRRVLDLFAGTGALGLEALSRGAARAVFVEGHPLALAALRRNVQSLGLEDRVRVLKADLARGPGRLKAEPAPFDLIFLDPPYGRGLIPRALALVARLGLLGPGALVVAEHSAGEDLEPLPEPLALTDQRAYGQTRVSFLHAIV